MNETEPKGRMTPKCEKASAAAKTVPVVSAHAPVHENAATGRAGGLPGHLQMPVSFTVPGRPQGKQRPRIGKVGQHARMFTPAKTANYESLVALAAQTAMAGHQVLDCALACRIFVACEVPSSWSGKKKLKALAGEILPGTKPDADNVVKAIFDGLNGVLWRDDVLVVDLTVRKRYAATPCVRVSVWPATEEPA